MNGILLVDKPAGWTSHDVVAKVRSILRQQAKSNLSAKDYGLGTYSPKMKVGHTGTLDPFATGLLILVIGSYTKRAGEFSKLDKTYEAELTLGKTSTTGDIEGEIQSKSTKEPAKSAVEAVLDSFLGEIWQTPHPYSAIKVGGQRAYKMARKGITPKVEPRKVTIYQLQATNYQYPKLCITARVSSGTYIRSLAEDTGQKLGTGAYLSSLRRTKIDHFNLKGALMLDKLSIKLIASNLKTVAN